MILRRKGAKTQRKAMGFNPRGARRAPQPWRGNSRAADRARGAWFAPGEFGARPVRRGAEGNRAEFARRAIGVRSLWVLSLAQTRESTPPAVREPLVELGGARQRGQYDSSARRRKESPSPLFPPGHKNTTCARSAGQRSAGPLSVSASPPASGRGRKNIRRNTLRYCALQRL